MRGNLDSYCKITDEINTQAILKTGVGARIAGRGLRSRVRVKFWVLMT